jgi:hypothetical protein
MLVFLSLACKFVPFLGSHAFTGRLWIFVLNLAGESVGLVLLSVLGYAQQMHVYVFADGLAKCA